MNHEPMPAQGPVDVNVRGWVPTTQQMPADETTVLIFRRGGEISFGELRWEKPTWEETFMAFRYWDDPTNDGQDWDEMEVTHWMPLPEAPNEQN